jgi:hypothetical protein
MKRLLVAAALLAAGTSAVLAQGYYGQTFRYGTSGAPAYRLGGGYTDPNFSSGYGQGLYDYAPGVYDYAPGYANYSGTASGQPGPDSGIESQR